MKTRNARIFKRKGKFYVYIVECKDKTYYTGYTNDLERRVEEHNNGSRGARYTRLKRPVELVYKKEYRYYKLAAQEERRIKSLRRCQKEKLINENKR